MVRFLDTSVIVRYLTNDDLPRARIAEQIIESDDLMISGVILSEVAYVLRTQYHYRARDIAASLVEFLWRANVGVVDVPKEMVAGALMKVTSSSGLSFGDALILAQMQASGCDELYSFDARFRDEAITVLNKPAK